MYIIVYIYFINTICIHILFYISLIYVCIKYKYIDTIFCWLVVKFSYIFNPLPKTDLNIFYQNVRGLRTKTVQFYNNILSLDYDIILITETWLQNDIFDSELSDGRYDIFRCDRDSRATGKQMGGGVMVCIRHELSAVLNGNWYCESIESLCLTISYKTLQSSANLHLILVYLPPDELKLPEYISSVQNNFTLLYNFSPADYYLMVGDFNVPCLKWCDNGYTMQHIGRTETQLAALSFVEEMQFLGLSQCNYHKNSCNNTLDLCFCNLPSTVNLSQPLTKLDPYHPPIEIKIADLYSKPLKEKVLPRYKFYKCNYDCINSFFNTIPWTEILNTVSFSSAIDVFYEKLNECFALHVPLSQKNGSYPVWYSSALIKIIKEKSKAHRKFKKYKNPRDYDEFALLRNRQRIVQKICFNNFTNNVERYIRHNPKYFWKYVKSKRGGSNYPKQFSIGDQILNEPNNICAAFNSFFESAFVRPNFASQVSLPAPDDISCYHDGEILSYVQVSKELVLSFLNSLDISKGPGCDSVPPIFLRSCAESLALPVSILFQRSLSDGIFPNIWKTALIVPIHKRGSRTKIENYRPISIINTLGKLLEKIVYNNVYPIISKGISSSQHGFMKNRSTLSNLTIFSNFVLEKMENGGQIDVIYTDFEKAFDRVDHTILLNKLYSLGIRGDLFRWITSYLSNRSQAVVLGGYKSDFIQIPSGVPQGSHLGPLFYNAYMFDISSCLPNSSHLLYADDKKIFKYINSIETCVHLQRDLDNLVNYYNKNKITVNFSKCQCISFSRKPNPLHFQYNFSGIPITRVDEVKDLGVMFDSKMSMTKHIDMIINKAFRNLGFIMRVSPPFKSILSLKILYTAYVRSILDYACPIWSPFYAIHINRIERIQKKFTSYLHYKFKKSTGSYSQSCRLYDLLTLRERRLLMDMSLLFDIVNGKIDSPILLSQIAFNTPKFRTRHSSLFHVPFHSTSYGENAVLSRIVRIYNEHFYNIDLFNSGKTAFKTSITKVITNTLDLI